MAKQAVAPTKITRDDLEHRFRSLQDVAKGKVDEKRTTFATIAGTGGVLLLLLVFLLGKRSGKKKTTLVEIRRV
jgi:cellobiose-specific phosphotransferase system component IIC